MNKYLCSPILVRATTIFAPFGYIRMVWFLVDTKDPIMRAGVVLMYHLVVVMVLWNLLQPSQHKDWNVDTAWCKILELLATEFIF